MDRWVGAARIFNDSKAIINLIGIFKAHDLPCPRVDDTVPANAHSLLPTNDVHTTDNVQGVNANPACSDSDPAILASEVAPIMGQIGDKFKFKFLNKYLSGAMQMLGTMITEVGSVVAEQESGAATAFMLTTLDT